MAAFTFRYNGPDALLVLLLLSAGYCTVRAVDSAPGRWLALAGSALGFAFLTSMAEAVVGIPAIGLLVFAAAPGSLRIRVRNLLIVLTTTALTVGWFVALVAISPADSRPHIDYIGAGRLAHTVGISWLLPAALIGLIAVLWFTRYAARTSLMRASLLFWGGWLLVSGLVFGYTLVMAPAIAALTAISVRELWRGRQFASSRATLALMLVAIAGWDFVLLARTPAWLRWTMLIGAVTVAAALLFRRDYVGRATVALCVAGLLFALGDTAAYTVHAVMDYRGGAVAADNRALDALLVGTDNRWAAATVGSQNAASLELNTGKSVMAIGGFSGADNWPTLDQFKGYAADGQIRYFIGASSASGAAGQISSWVAANFVQQRIGDVTVYDLAC